MSLVAEMRLVLRDGSLVGDSNSVLGKFMTANLASIQEISRVKMVQNYLYDLCKIQKTSLRMTYNITTCNLQTSFYRHMEIPIRIFSKFKLEMLKMILIVILSTLLFI